MYTYLFKPKHFLSLISIFLSFISVARGQDSLGNTPLTMSAAFQLALQNSVQLQTRHVAIDLARQQTAVEKLDRLPELSTNLNYGYLSNSNNYTPNFDHHSVTHLPHHLTQFTVDASETIFSGGRINNTIKKAGLEEQIAYLNLEKDQVDIKFLVAAGYLDIFRLLNQRKVFINNTNLARQRLKNILELRRQGIVTQNDVLRTELTISDYELNTRNIARSIVELNNQLNVVLGLSDKARIIPDTTLITSETPVASVEDLLNQADHENHEINISLREKQIAETNLRIIKSQRSPTLSLFASNNFSRPYLTSIPAADIYYNYWVAGASLHYNIGSLYQSPRKIKSGSIYVELTGKRDSLVRQNVEVGVRNNFVLYNQSVDQLQTARHDLHSAEENYRIVEQRYFNKLALLTDLIDATNIKIEAELKVTNAEIERIYSYCRLQKAIGIL